MGVAALLFALGATEPSPPPPNVEALLLGAGVGAAAGAVVGAVAARLLFLAWNDDAQRRSGCVGEGCEAFTLAATWYPVPAALVGAAVGTAVGAAVGFGIARLAAE